MKSSIFVKLIQKEEGIKYQMSFFFPFSNKQENRFPECSQNQYSVAPLL